MMAFPSDRPGRAGRAGRAVVAALVLTAAACSSSGGQAGPAEGGGGAVFASANGADGGRGIDASESTVGDDPVADPTVATSPSDTAAGVTVAGGTTAGSEPGRLPAGDPASTGPGGGSGAFDPGATLGPAPAPVAGSEPVRFGMNVAGAASLQTVETAAGAHLGMIRVFARWDTPFPTAEQRRWLEAGRVLHLSIRPRTESGERIAWADIAAAQPGSPLYDQLDRWARTAARYGPQLYLTFNHEPETKASAGQGTPADFRAAWRKLVTQLRADGGDQVRTVLVLGRGPYADGSAAQWYPGDDVVDVVGVDAYNWYRCQGGPRPWTAPADLLAGALSFAVAHGKPLAVPEIASDEDPADPRAKARWILALATTLASPPMVGRVAFAAWFNTADPVWPACDWRYDSSPSSAQAMTAAVAWLAPRS